MEQSVPPKERSREKIGYEERGENGFGYDPIFYLPDMSRTTAELSPEEKKTQSATEEKHWRR